MVAAYSVCALPTCHGTRHQVIVFWPNSFLLQAPGTPSLKSLLPMLGQVRSARRLSSLGVAPNHQLTGAGPVAQLLGPLVETSLRPVLCRLPEVPSRREIHLLRAVTCSLMYRLVTFFPTLLVHLPSQLLALQSLSWVWFWGIPTQYSYNSHKYSDIGSSIY